MCLEGYWMVIPITMSISPGDLMMWFCPVKGKRLSTIISVKILFHNEHKAYELIVYEESKIKTWFLWEKENKKSWRVLIT
jgi:hypothetical protein